MKRKSYFAIIFVAGLFGTAALEAQDNTAPAVLDLKRRDPPPPVIVFSTPRAGGKSISSCSTCGKGSALTSSNFSAAPRRRETITRITIRLLQAVWEAILFPEANSPFRKKVCMTSE